MSQPFNSPRHAIEWLTKRKVISGAENEVLLYAPNRREMVYEGQMPREKRLDYAAEDMLNRYGYIGSGGRGLFRWREIYGCQTIRGAMR